MNGFLLNTLPPLLLFGLGLAGVSDHPLWAGIYTYVRLHGFSFGMWMMGYAVFWLLHRSLP